MNRNVGWPAYRCCFLQRDYKSHWKQSEKITDQLEAGLLLATYAVLPNGMASGRFRLVNTCQKRKTFPALFLSEVNISVCSGTLRTTNIPLLIQVTAVCCSIVSNSWPTTAVSPWACDRFRIESEHPHSWARTRWRNRQNFCQLPGKS